MIEGLIACLWTLVYRLWFRISEMFTSKEDEDFGCCATKKEKYIDSFRKGCLIVYQGSAESNTVFIACSIEENFVQIYILFLLNEKVYKFTQISEADTTSPLTEISVGGLRIEIREPFRRLRISFRGCLKAEGSTIPQFIHIQSVWAPVSDPCFIFNDVPSSTQARLMTEKIWDNEQVELNWSFSQFGVMRMRWKVDDDIWNEEDFRGVRANVSRPDAEKLSIERITTNYCPNGERAVLFSIRHPNREDLIQFGKKLGSDHSTSYISNIKKNDVDSILNDSMQFNAGASMTVEINKLKHLKETGVNVEIESCEIIPFRPRKQFTYIASEIERTMRVLPFTNFCCLDPNVSGGKASNLARLCGIQTGFKVPKGVVVAVAAYEAHLKDNEEVFEFIDSLDICSLAPEEIEKKTSDLFLSSKISSSTRTCLATALNNVFDSNLELEGILFAVRSSAIGEDGAEISSAGQLESYLNLSREEIEKAILNCWASNFRKEVVAYRREHGQKLNTSVAVVVQEMVTNGISGVMFTVDPISLNPSRLVVNLVEGCGEDLVSGHKTPSQIVFDKSNGSVVKEVGVSLLTPEICSNLVSVAKSLEFHFQYPQDIEFVVKDNVSYIVQSRNITNLNLESDWEVIHEFDGANLTDYQMPSTANVGEVMNYPFSSMDSSTLVFIYGQSIMKMINHLNCIKSKIPKHTQNVLFLYKNKIFLDVMECYMREWQNVSKDTISQINLAGTTFITKEMVELGKTRFPQKTGKDRLISLFRIYKMIRKDADIWLNEMKDTLSEMRLSSHGNDVGSWTRTLEVLTTYLAKLVYYHSFETTFSNVTYVFVAMILRGTPEGDLSPAILTAIAAVYSNNPLPIISGDIPISLKNIALLIKNDSKWLSIVTSDTPAEEKVAQLKKSKDEIGSKIREFFVKHGHRGLHELLLLGVPWNDDADGFITAIKTLISDPKLSVHQSKVTITDIDKLIDSLNLNITGIRRKFLKYLIPNAYRAVFYREEAKNWLVDGTNIFRLAIKRLGGLLKQNNYLPEEKLAFFLTISEINTLIRNKDHISGLISRARRRLRVYNQLEDLQYPLVSVGLPKPKSSFIPHDGDELILKGTAVCEGKVKGRARVAMNLSDAQDISPDEILITPCTDIAWSPLFPVIRGLITEIGGLLSHGAVVAREYGLPCIIAVEGATDKFKTGDHVLLDAFNGTIERLPDNSSTSNGLTPL